MSMFRRITAFAVATVVVGSVGAVAVATPAVADTGTGYSTASCPNLFILGVRGSGQEWKGQNPSSAGTQVETTSEKFMSQLRGTRYKSKRSVRFYAVPYSATKAKSAVASPTAEFGDSVRNGIKNTYDIINGLGKRCPSSKVLLIGFSQGAEVVSEVMRRNGTAGYVPSRVIAAVSVADPTRKWRDGGTFYGFGRHVNDFGYKYRNGNDKQGTLTGAPESKTGNSGRVPAKSAAQKMLSICEFDDEICNNNSVKISGSHTAAYQTKTNSTLSASRILLMLKKNGFKF